MSREFEHTCHHPQCEKLVPPAMFACRPHWFSLPKKYRTAIWREYEPGQEISMTPTSAYLQVATDAVRWWIEQDEQKDN